MKNWRAMKWKWLNKCKTHFLSGAKKKIYRLDGMFVTTVFRPKQYELRTNTGGRDEELSSQMRLIMITQWHTISSEWANSLAVYLELYHNSQKNMAERFLNITYHPPPLIVKYWTKVILRSEGTELFGSNLVKGDLHNLIQYKCSYYRFFDI